MAASSCPEALPRPAAVGRAFRRGPRRARLRGGVPAARLARRKAAPYVSLVGRAFTARLARRKAAPYVSHQSADRGFSLVEVLIATLVLTIGMIAIAAMLAVTTQMQIGAREAARSTRLAQDKVDELMKLNFTTNALVAVGGNLDADVANHSETLAAPLTGITLRWAVASGPTSDTRVLTVRVVNLRAQQYRQTNLTTIIRQW